MSIAEKLNTIAENEEKVYEAGKNDIRNSVWEALQQRGARTSYDSICFNSYWNSDNFNPIYDIIPTTLNRAFERNHLEGKEPVDLTELCKRNNIKFDTTNCTVMTRAFASDLFSRLPEIDLRDKTTTLYLFYGGNGTNLKKIDKIISNENSRFQSNCFGYSILEEVTWEGVIAHYLTITSMYLNAESTKGIISCLKNYKGTDLEYTEKLILNDEVWQALDNAYTSPNGGSWKDYVYEELAWNV